MRFVSVPVYAARSRAGVFYLLVLFLYGILLLGIWRPLIRIPAVAKNGDINAHPSARRSLSGTHFAREGSDARAENGSGRCAPRAYSPEAGGFIRLPCAVGAESHQRKRGKRDC